MAGALVADLSRDEEASLGVRGTGHMECQNLHVECKAQRSITCLTNDIRSQSDNMLPSPPSKEDS